MLAETEAMVSLRLRLFSLWLMLAASGTATGFLLFEFYRQSANVQLGQAEQAAARGCREISDRYAFLFAGSREAASDRTADEIKRQLTAAVQTALANATGVEGGIWRASEGSIAYAFPTYEGTGPKTDVPVAELTTIKQAMRKRCAAAGPRPSASRDARKCWPCTLVPWRDPLATRPPGR